MKKNKKERKEISKGIASLPTNRKELFFDVIKLRWRSVILLGFIFFLTLIPFIACLFLRRIIYNNLLITPDVTDYDLLFCNCFYFSIASISLLIPAIFLGGILKNLKNLSYEDPIFLKEDFKSGIKENFLAIFISTFILILFVIATLICFSIKPLPGIIKGLLAGITLLVCFPITLLIYHQSILYKNKLIDYFYNAFLLYIRNFLYILLLTVINLIPLFVIFISNPIIYVTCLVLYFLLIEPFVLLFDVIFLNYIFDKSLNQKYYPEIYQKGLYTGEKGEEDMFNLETTFNDIKKDPIIGKYANHLLDFKINQEALDKPIFFYETDVYRKARVAALNDLAKYEQEHRVDYHEFNDHSSYMMFKQTLKSKVAIVIAGGGYLDCCTLPESFPVAIELYKRGFTTFTFDYGINKDAYHGASYQDLVIFLRYLLDNQETLNIDMKDYLIIGFSASSHLVATLGTDNFGYKVVGLPKPKLMVLCYPVITMKKKYAEVGSRFALLGENPTSEEENMYSIEEHVDKDFPRVFMYQSENDEVVDIHNSMMMDEVLTRNNIPHIYYQVPGTYHGHGIASGTSAEGWIDRMLDYYRNDKTR